MSRPRHCETCACPDPYPVAPADERCPAVHLVFMTYDRPREARCRLQAGHGTTHRSDADTVCWETVERRLGT